MISKVKFVIEAALEFRQALQWYKSKINGLDLIFIKEIDKTIERIKIYPQLYPVIIKNIRKVQMTTFPYSIFYKVDNDILIILHLFHNKKKPIKWKNN